MNIRLVKNIDRTIGLISVFTVPSPAHSDVPDCISSLLIIRPGGIGDAVQLAPTIRRLRKHFADIHLSILAEKRNAGVFALMPGVDAILCYDCPRELLQALRGRFDVVIDTEQWHRLSAVVARLIPAPVKIGFDTNERRRMFTHTLTYSHDDYETDSFIRLLQPLRIDDGEVRDEMPWLTVPVEADEQANTLLKPLANSPFVTMFPGASIPERRWGADRFHAVTKLLADLGVNTVVVGGQVDREQGDSIVEGTAGLNLAGQTSLAGTAAVLKRSRLLLSGDSGVLHIGVGLGVPTVSLFGPGRAKKWAPRCDHDIVIHKELPCSPCTTFGTTPACTINVRCMQEISVDEVTNAVMQLLRGTQDAYKGN